MAILYYFVQCENEKRKTNVKIPIRQIIEYLQTANLIVFSFQLVIKIVLF